MQIAIASGKGGTGKTTISVVLAAYLASQKERVNILDCDVEEPNVNLFLKFSPDKKEAVFSVVPEVNLDKCDSCGRCSQICNFSAIVSIKDKPLVLSEMCHACGGCFLVCSSGALTKKKKEIGFREEAFQGQINYYGGKLKIGEAMSPPLIKAVKEKISLGFNLLDSPPGTSCPAIEAIGGSDYVILVTEPTPFGLHDLKLAVEMVRALKIDFGVLINRSDLGDDRVVKFCQQEKINILASIPNSRKIAESYSKGELVDIFLEEYQSDLKKIVQYLKILENKE